MKKNIVIIIICTLMMISSCSKPTPISSNESDSISESEVQSNSDNTTSIISNEPTNTQSDTSQSESEVQSSMDSTTSIISKEPTKIPTNEPTKSPIYGEKNSNGTRNYYVDAVKGKANGIGTKSNPFKSIADAMAQVYAGDNVYLSDGIYEETVVMVSGEKGKPVTLAARDGAKPVISNALQYKGTWEKYKNNIYVTDISSIADKINSEYFQLFYQEKALVEARWPNMGPYIDGIMDYKRAVAQLGTNKNTIVTNSSLPQDIIGATVCVWPGDEMLSGWVMWKSTVASINDKKITLSDSLDTNEPIIGLNAYSPVRGNAFFVMNHLSLLDAPGEFYYDKKTSKLYLQMPDNTDPSNKTIMIRSKNSIAIDASYMEYINLTGLTVLGGGIYMDNTSNSTIDRCDIKYADHYYGSGYASHRMPSSNVVIGSNNKVKNSDIGPTAGNGILFGGSDSSIENCKIHDSNYSGNDFAGIYLKPGRNLLIANNTISNSARSHIFFEIQSEFEKCIVRNNHLIDHATLNSDCGAVWTYETDGGGTEIYNNLVDCGERNDNGTMTKLREGLYIDHLSTGFSVHHNIVLGGYGGLHVNLPNNGTSFFNNTVIGSDHGFGSLSVPSNNASGIGFVFKDNLFVDIKGVDIHYYGTEKGIPKSYIGNFVDGTMPIPLNPERRCESSGNIRGEVDSLYRSIGTTAGAIMQDEKPFCYGVDCAG